MTDSLPCHDRPPSAVLRLAGLVWLSAAIVAHAGFFLPNNPQFHRATLWRNLPALWLETAFPSPPDPADAVEQAVASHTRWAHLLQRLPLWGGAALLWAAATGLGRAALRVVHLPACGADAWVLAAAAGMGLLTLLALAAGLAGLLRFVPFGAAVVLCAGAAVADAARSMLRARVRASEQARDDGSRPGVSWRAVAVAAPFAVVILAGAPLPEVDFDVKAYHFVGPKEWYQQGRITFLEHNVYTNFPFLTEMLPLLGMVLSGDWYWGALIGKTALAGFAFLTAYAAGRLAEETFGRPAGAWAAFLVLSTPWIYRIATIAYAEGGLTAYLALAAWATARAAAADRSSADRRAAARWTFFAGLMAGNAMACKYPGLVSVVVPLGAAAVVRAWILAPPGAPRIGRALRHGLVFGLGAAAAVGPWLAKNAAFTGNPVYPLGYSVFGGRDWSPEDDAKWRQGHSAPNYELRDLAEKLVDVTLKSDWTSPLFLGLAPLAFFSSRRRPAPRGPTTLAVYLLWLFLTWWLLTHRIDRFWIPLIPVAAVLAGGGAAAWSTGRSRFGLYALAALVGQFQLWFMTSGLCGYNQYRLDLETARRMTIPPAIACLQGRVPAGEAVLCVGEAQVFDADFETVYHTVFDRPIFEQWVSGRPGAAAAPLRSAEEIRQRFRERRVTRVLVNWREVLRYRLTYGYTGFVTPARFDELVEMGVLSRPEACVPPSPLDALSEREAAELQKFAPELADRRRTGRTGGWSSIEVYRVVR